MKKKVQILGGGLTARLAALALADVGCEIHWVKKEVKKGVKEAGAARLTHRALALNPATLAILRRLDIDPQGVDIEHIGIYAADDRPHIFMPGLIISPQDLSEEIGSKKLGKIVLEKDLLDDLDAGLQARNIDVSSHVSSYISPGVAGSKKMSEKTNEKTDEKISADLVIDTEFPSFAPGDDYGQTALAGMISHEEPHENMAAQFFFPSGPLALLPLKDNHSAFIWTRRNENAKNLFDLDKEKFLLFLRQFLPPLKRDIDLIGDVHAHPLRFFFAPEWSRGNQLLIGEAAHRVHPLAGQGWNICAEDVRLLAAMADEAESLGLDVFSSSMLADYHRRRRAHAGALARSIDWLGRFPFLSGRAAAACLDMIALSKNMRRFFAHAGAGVLQSSFRASSAKRTGMPSRTG